MQDTNINFNLFIAEEFCKLISSPSNQVITKDLFSTTNKDFVVLNNSLALPELTQKFLDDIIYDKKEIVERISKIFSSRSRYNLSFYKNYLKMIYLLLLFRQIMTMFLKIIFQIK